MKIDTHIHLYDPQVGSFDWPEPGSPLYREVLPADFLDVAASYGIARAVVVACTVQPEQTRYILESLHDHPAVAAVIGFIDIHSTDFERLYEQFCRYAKFRGFRFLCSQDEQPSAQALRNVALMSGKRVNVLEFLGSRHAVARWRPVIENNPDVSFVIEHFAWERTDVREPEQGAIQFMSEMSMYRNVSMKLSALIPLAGAPVAPREPEYYAPILEAVYHAFGEERCLFGSDWPLLELKGDYGTTVHATEMFLARKSPAALEKVMGRNAQRIYRLDCM